MTTPTGGEAVTGTFGRFSRLPGSEDLTVRMLQVAGVLTFLFAWQVLGEANPSFYSTPTRVVGELGELLFQDELLENVLTSSIALVIGIVISLVGGVAVGLVLGRFRVARVILDPYLAAYYSVPRVAFVPLMVIWFGINREFVIASVVFATFVLIVFATAAGVREAGSAYFELARSIKLSERQLFTKVLLPGSIPFIATGMRLGVQRALVAVIVAEFLVGLPGVGLMLREARVTLATDRLFAVAIVTMIIGIVIVLMTSYVERRLSSWRPQIF